MSHLASLLPFLTCPASWSKSPPESPLKTKADPMPPQPKETSQASLHLEKASALPHVPTPRHDPRSPPSSPIGDSPLESLHLLAFLLLFTHACHRIMPFCLTLLFLEISSLSFWHIFSLTNVSWHISQFRRTFFLLS